MLKSALSSVYGLITNSRESLYKKNILKIQKLSKPVIVIGNISAGGTGKTPMVQYVLELLTSKSKKAGIVSRGYRGDYQGVVKVNLAKDNAWKQYGDEPVLHALKNKETPVYLCKQRVLAGKELIEQEQGIDAIISDDGFQHFAMARDLNIALIDCTEDIKNYKLLPAGRLRESLVGLERADFIIFTKHNWVEPSLAQKNRDYVLSSFNSKKIKTGIADYNVSLPKLTSKKIILVSSIAQPDNFYKTINELNKVEIVDHIVFQDHHKYTSLDIDKIKAVQAKHNNAIIVTTEKDGVKLSTYKTESFDYVMAEVKVSLIEGYEELNYEIDQLFIKKNN